MEKKKAGAQTNGSLAWETAFKGKPVLALLRGEGDKYPFKFGVVKAGLILAHLDAIREFHAKHQRKEVPATA